MTLPLSSWASIAPTKMKKSIPQTPFSFSTPAVPRTATYEWGCPVAEVVSAPSGAEAMSMIKMECIEEAKRAAQEKPGVSDIIKISVIAPDVLVSRHEGGFYLKGTFFLETVVFQK